MNVPSVSTTNLRQRMRGLRRWLISTLRLRRAHQDLAGLGPYELRDIGLSHGDAARRAGCLSTLDPFAFVARRAPAPLNSGNQALADRGWREARPN